MIGRATGIVLAIVAARVAPAAPQVFKAGVDAVQIDVSVRQGSRLVSGLTAADFSLLDNGVPQSVRVSEIEKLPIDVSILLDTSGSVQGSELDALKNAVRDAAHALSPTDRIRLLTFADAIREVFPYQAANAPLPLDGVKAGGATVLYDALGAALMASRPPDRRSLVIAFTDGRDTRSIFDADTTREIARRADAVLQMVVSTVPTRVVSTSTGGRIGATGNMVTVTGSRVTTIGGTTTTVTSQPDPRLVAVATATGGGVTPFDLRSSLSQVFTRLIADFRTGYVLVYTPTGVRHDGWHDVKVSIKRPGTFDVHARQGYDGGPPGP